MSLLVNQLYHCYNQGNNRERVFRTDKDYLLFLTLIRKHISPCCALLAWCLMPNHFHFLMQTNIASVQPVRLGNIESQALNDEMRKMLSGYAQLFNQATGRTGSLFRQKTKFKGVSDGDRYYDLTIQDYIHYNPVAAGLVKEAIDWPYSSAREYAGLRKGTLVNVMEAKKILQL